MSTFQKTIREWKVQHWFTAFLWIAAPISFALCQWLAPPYHPISLGVPLGLVIFGMITWNFSWQKIVHELQPLHFRPGNLLVLAMIGAAIGCITPRIMYALASIPIQIPLYESCIWAMIGTILCMCAEIPIQLDQLEIKGKKEK